MNKLQITSPILTCLTIIELCRVAHHVSPAERVLLLNVTRDMLDTFDKLPSHDTLPCLGVADDARLAVNHLTASVATNPTAIDS